MVGYQPIEKRGVAAVRQWQPQFEKTGSNKRSPAEPLSSIQPPMSPALRYHKSKCALILLLQEIGLGFLPPVITILGLLLLSPPTWAALQSFNLTLTSGWATPGTSFVGFTH